MTMYAKARQQLRPAQIPSRRGATLSFNTYVLFLKAVDSRCGAMLAAKQQHHLYRYKELPSPQHCRLLTLCRPRRGSQQRGFAQFDHFYGGLSVHEHGGGAEYVCLSYCWGDDSDGGHCLWIGEEERRIMVRSNLTHALRFLQTVKKSLRIWIDSVCIDQRDDAEREKQIQAMEEIYKRAEFVIAHLGAEADSSDHLPEFFDRIELGNLKNSLAATEVLPDRPTSGAWVDDEYMARQGSPSFGDHLWASFRAFVS
jgi:hypothetical protein